MPVTRSVGCLGRDERRDRIAGREGLVQRLVLVVAFVLLAVLAVLGGFGRTVAVVLGREILAIAVVAHCGAPVFARSEEHTSELQSLMRISYAVICLKKKNKNRIKCRV